MPKGSQNGAKKGKFEAQRAKAKTSIRLALSVRIPQTHSKSNQKPTPKSRNIYRFFNEKWYENGTQNGAKSVQKSLLKSTYFYIDFSIDVYLQK